MNTHLDAGLDANLDGQRKPARNWNVYKVHSDGTRSLWESGWTEEKAGAYCRKWNKQGGRFQMERGN